MLAARRSPGAAYVRILIAVSTSGKGHFLPPVAAFSVIAMIHDRGYLDLMSLPDPGIVRYKAHTLTVVAVLMLLRRLFE